MQLTELLRTRAAIFAHDLIMISLAWLGAFWLRFNMDVIPAAYWTQMVQMLPVVLLVQGSILWYLGLYRGVWRFASVPDLLRIAVAVVTGVSISAAAIFMLTRLQQVPRSVFMVEGLLLVFLLGGPRFAYRLLKDRRHYSSRGKKVLIVGAGQAGEMLARDLTRDLAGGYQAVAFVDDDSRKHGKDIHGIRVMGSCLAIPGLVREHGIDAILIAIPSAGSRQIRRIVELCEQSGVGFRILPRMQDLISGQVGIKQVREVKIDDLLGRESVSLDWEAIASGVRGKSILVTGGGGSIGAELCRQIARLGPTKLVIIEHSEFSLYTIELELARQYPDLSLVSLLCDIGDKVAVERALRRYRPDIIFHAAAYKHVPMLEQQVRSAVRNNVLGTRTLASLAAQCGCDAFVMVSTDKAVNPGNIMGMTKRVAEIYCQNLATCSKTRFITVRFGNVLGSAGSVIPLFQNQITEGGPVTVTHPEITRYFMTIPEASQLILQAGAMGNGGEIFVLDMGEPVRIAYLAEQLIRLSGKKPGDDIEIVYTGLRPGEKLYEELFHESERLAGTSHPKILLANSRLMDLAALERTLDTLAQACDECDDNRVHALLCELVPENQWVLPDIASDSPNRKKGAVIYSWKSPSDGGP